MVLIYLPKRYTASKHLATIEDPSSVRLTHAQQQQPSLPLRNSTSRFVCLDSHMNFSLLLDLLHGSRMLAQGIALPYTAS